MSPLAKEMSAIVYNRYTCDISYAIGDLTKSYTNKIPMFSKIYYARRHSEVSNLEILVYNKTIEAELKKKKHDKSKWEDLYITLKHLNGEL